MSCPGNQADNGESIMTNYTVARGFTHRTFGDIGAVNLVADVAKVTIDGKELPETSVEYLLNFALQSLQDAYAGAKNGTEAAANFDKKLKALIEGTIGVRTGASAGVTEEVAVQRSITRTMAKTKMGAKSEAWAKFTGFTDAEQSEKLDAWYEANKAALEPAVKEELARREKARKAKALLGSAVAFEL